MYFNQDEFDIRCEWGEAGIAQLAQDSDAIVIVDVLSFSTAVDIAVGNGAVVYPYRWRDESAVAYASSLNAILAGSWRSLTGGYTLAPTSLLHIAAGTRLVLPSPNGSTLTLATGRIPTFAGCLRNARAVASAVQKAGTRISVIPAGERWADGSLRPAIEDLIGAGAIIHYLRGEKSPEALVAESAFMRFSMELASCLKHSGSGKELAQQGFESDVALAAALDVSECVPMLVDGAYVSRS